MKTRYKILFQAHGAFGMSLRFYGNESTEFLTELSAMEYIKENPPNFCDIPDEGFHFLIIPVVSIYKEQ